MTLLSFIERVLVPVVVITLLLGGIGGVVLGFALAVRSDAAIRFMARMNRWVSTRQFFQPLDTPHNVVPPARPDGRRPVLGAFLVIAGAAAVFLLLVRLDFSRPYAPTVNMLRYLISGVALETMKWVLVAGSAFACVVGAMMLAWPHHYAALEQRLNRWVSTRDVLPPASSETMRIALEPYVEAHPRAAGWAIGLASLLVTLSMLALLFMRVR
jgi:hypothetical protein